MIKMLYPEQKPKIKTEAGIEQIFCIIRKRWMVLTPEEWVRQNVLLSLIFISKYPASLISVEKKIKLLELSKRFDIVVFDRMGNPYMLIECKEMNVPLSEQTLEQALRYNLQIQAPVFILCNGRHCIGFRKTDRGEVETLHEIPSFSP